MRIVVQDQLKAKSKRQRLSGTYQVESVSKRMKITENSRVPDQFPEFTEKAPLTETLSAETFSNPVIVEQIVSHLPPQDIKTAARVCRMWRIVVDHPRYWTWAKLHLGKHNFEEVFPTRRFRSIATIKMVNPSLSTVQLRSVLLEFEHLRFLDFGSTDLSYVPADVLAEGLVNLRKAEFENTKLTQDQAETLFLKIMEKSELKLRFLKIRFNDLSSVCPEILSSAIIRLAEVNLGYTQLTSHQVNTLMRMILTEKLTLRKLIIGGNDFSSVAPDILSRAMGRLKTGNLMSTYLSRGQMNALDSIGFYNY